MAHVLGEQAAQERSQASASSGFVHPCQTRTISHT